MCLKKIMGWIPCSGSSNTKKKKMKKKLEKIGLQHMGDAIQSTPGTDIVFVVLGGGKKCHLWLVIARPLFLTIVLSLDFCCSLRYLELNLMY